MFYFILLIFILYYLFYITYTYLKNKQKNKNQTNNQQNNKKNQPSPPKKPKASNFFCSKTHLPDLQKLLFFPSSLGSFTSSTAWLQPLLSIFLTFVFFPLIHTKNIIFLSIFRSLSSSS